MTAGAALVVNGRCVRQVQQIGFWSRCGHGVNRGGADREPSRSPRCRSHVTLAPVSWLSRFQSPPVSRRSQSAACNFQPSADRATLSLWNRFALAGLDCPAPVLRWSSAGGPLVVRSSSTPSFLANPLDLLGIQRILPVGFRLFCPILSHRAEEWHSGGSGPGEVSAGPLPAPRPRRGISRRPCAGS